jgi:flagellar motor switch protein FliN/FliY
MATQGASAIQEAAPGVAALVAPEREVVPAPVESVSLASQIEERVGLAPLLLEVRLPVRNLRVKDILALEMGKVYETGWPADEDLPAGCAGVQLAWAEFEVIDKKLAVRVTRLA